MPLAMTCKVINICSNSNASILVLVPVELYGFFFFKSVHSILAIVPLVYHSLFPTIHHNS